MKRFTVQRTLMGAEITAQVLCLDKGVQISLYGGTLPHIGAVSAAGPDGNVNTWQFPTHKEGVVSERWARALSEAGYRPAAVSAGIHYDNLTREEISLVVSVTDDMLSEVLKKLL